MLSTKMADKKIPIFNLYFKKVFRDILDLDLFLKIFYLDLLPQVTWYTQQ